MMADMISAIIMSNSLLNMAVPTRKMRVFK